MLAWLDSNCMAKIRHLVKRRLSFLFYFFHSPSIRSAPPLLITFYLLFPFLLANGYAWAAGILNGIVNASMLGVFRVRAISSCVFSPILWFRLFRQYDAVITISIDTTRCRRFVRVFGFAVEKIQWFASMIRLCDRIYPRLCSPHMKHWSKIAEVC